MPSWGLEQDSHDKETTMMTIRCSVCEAIWTETTVHKVSCLRCPACRRPVCMPPIWIP